MNIASSVGARDIIKGNWHAKFACGQIVRRVCSSR